MPEYVSIFPPASPDDYLRFEAAVTSLQWLIAGMDTIYDRSFIKHDASDYPAGHKIQSASGYWFINDATYGWVQTQDPNQSYGASSEKEEEPAMFSGPIADDVSDIAKRLKSIEPKYPSPKPPYGSLDTWAKGTVRENDGWLWRWDGMKWDRERPA